MSFFRTLFGEKPSPVQPGANKPKQPEADPFLAPDPAPVEKKNMSQEINRAVYQKNIDEVRKLLAAGADVNGRSGGSMMSTKSNPTFAARRAASTYASSSFSRYSSVTRGYELSIRIPFFLSAYVTRSAWG